MIAPVTFDRAPYRPAPGEVPTSPGVYRFRGPDKRVLYVGKAKNLRARLSNYFGNYKTLHERTRTMVQAAVGVEWTVVRSELEALQLEFSWINEFDPPFNVQFKDDKSYPYLAVTLGDESPRAIVTRKRGIKGAKYFGPYPKLWALNDTLKQLEALFPIRTCKDSDYRSAMQTGKPCFASQIGRCHGPCSQQVSIEEHRLTVLAFVSFLNTQDRRILQELTEKMNEAAECQDYERAALLRDRLQAATIFFERSAVVFQDHEDFDVLGLAHDELAAAAQLFVIRRGQIRAVHSWTVDKELDVPIAELVEHLVQNAYGLDLIPAPRIYVSEVPNGSEVLEAWLGERAGRRVRIIRAQRGDKAALHGTVEQNAAQALMLYKNRRNSDYKARTDALEEIRKELGLKEAPLRIECFDVSHLGGTNIVASMVVFEDGLPRKSEYRKFTIDEAVDDTDAIYQVLRRRLAHLIDPEFRTLEGRENYVGNIEVEVEVEVEVEKVDAANEYNHVDNPRQERRAKFTYPPQLLIVDGGQPQVAAAQKALDDASADGMRQEITICGIAKRLEEVWLPNDQFPIIFPRASEGLFLLQRLRDEAHRFAITHQRQRRSKNITSKLAEVPGIGDSKVRALLNHFGSLKRVVEASQEELQVVPGIGPALAGVIVRTLNP